MSRKKKKPKEEEKVQMFRDGYFRLDLPDSFNVALGYANPGKGSATPSYVETYSISRL
jgi:hypothetical protein